MDTLLQNRSDLTQYVRLAVGAGKSAVWAQIFADILQLPAETVNTNQTGALGRAIAVDAAVGDCASIHEAAENVLYLLRDAAPS